MRLQVCFGLPVMALLLVAARHAAAEGGCIWHNCYRVISYGNAKLSLSRLDFYKCTLPPALGDDAEHCVAPLDARSAVEAQVVMLDLEEIPRGFCWLSELELLSLHHNRISVLSPDAGDEQVRSTELACAEGSRLRILDLRFNKLQTIDLRVLFTLVSLREAWFDYNEIDQILPIDSADATLYKLNNLPLRLLSLRGNRLRTIDVSLLQVVSLQHVDLSYNRIARVTNLRWRTSANVDSEGESLDAGELQTIKNLRMMRGVTDEHFHRVLNVSLFGNDFSSLFEELRTLEASRHLYQGFSINFAEPSKNLFYMLIKYLKDFDFLSINVTDGTIRCDCTLFPTLSGLRSLVKPQSQFVSEVATIRRLIAAIHCASAPDYDQSMSSFEAPVSLMHVDDSKLTCIRQTNLSEDAQQPAQCPATCTCFETPGRSVLFIDCHDQKLIGTPEGINFYIDTVLKRWKFTVWNQTSLSANGNRVNLTIDLSNNYFTDVDFESLLPADVDNAVVTLDVTANRLIDPKSALDSLARLATRFNGSALRVRLSGNNFGCLCNDSHSIESLTRRLTLNRLALDVMLHSVLRQCSTVCNVSTLSSTTTTATTTPPPNDLFVAVPNATAMLVVAALCTVCVLVLLFALLAFHFYTRMRRRRHATSTKVLVATPNGCECTASPHAHARPRGVCVYQNIVNNVDLFSDVPHFATLRPAHVKSTPQFDSCNTSPLARAANKRCMFATQQQPCDLSRSQTLLGCGETDENELNGRVGACRFAVSDWSEEPTRIRTDGLDVDITAV